MEENKNKLRQQIRTMLHMQRDLDKEILSKKGLKNILTRISRSL